MCIQIALIAAEQSYPNTYGGGLQFFTAPEGRLVTSNQIPCHKVLDELADLLDDNQMCKGNNEKGQILSWCGERICRMNNLKY